MQADELADAVVLAVQAALAPIVARVAMLEASGLAAAAAGAELAKDVGALRERAAVLETRAPVPGPAGVDGQAGAPGKDGADGLGFGELAIERRGDRTIAIVASRDGQTKELGVVTFDVPLYRGVYEAGRPYEAGDMVTYGGSEWTAREATATRPETVAGAKAWTLSVKRGRDGRDLRS